MFVIANWYRHEWCWAIAVLRPCYLMWFAGILRYFGSTADFTSTLTYLEQCKANEQVIEKVDKWWLLWNGADTFAEMPGVALIPGAEDEIQVPVLFDKSYLKKKTWNLEDGTPPKHTHRRYLAPLALIAFKCLQALQSQFATCGCHICFAKMSLWSSSSPKKSETSPSGWIVVFPLKW